MKRYSVILLLGFSLLYSSVSFSQEPKLILPIGHTLGVTAADFSPDGKRILTAALDNTAKIWDAETGRLLANLTGHTDTLVTARFSPNGKKIVTACEDGTAKIWDTYSTLMLADLPGHKGKVFLADFSPDGKKIFTAAQDGIIKIWEAETGKLLFDLKGHTQQVYVASFSRDGKKIISSSDDSTAKLWDVETGKMLVDFKGHLNEIWFVDLSPDGKKVITGSRDSTARIWDASTGAVLKDIRDHHAEVSIVRFSPDGKRFVTASDDGDVKLWDAVSLSLVTNIKAKKTFSTKREYYYPEVARAADFSPDSKKLLTIYLDSSTNIWDANTGKLLTEVKRGSVYVNGTFISKDSKKFSLGLATGNAQIYDLTKGTLLTDLRGDATFVVVFNYNRDCNRILVVNQTGPLKLLDAETNQLIRLFHSSAITSNIPQGFFYEFSQDGKKIIGYGGEGFTRVFDASTGNHLWDLTGDNPIYRSDDPHWDKIITASLDSLKIWNVSDGKLRLSIKNGSTIRAHQLSANGKRVAAFSREDSTTKIWDIQTGVLVGKLKFYPPKPGYPNFSPTGEKWFFYSDGDTTLTVWNANTGTVLYSIKELNVGAAFFSPDGKKIIINSLVEFLPIVKLYDAETGMLLTGPPNYRYNLGYLFSKDGNKTTYSLNDNTFATWDFEQKKKYCHI